MTGSQYAEICRAVHASLAPPKPTPVHDLRGCPECHHTVCMTHHQCQKR
jgi:hypothetical protein